MTKIWLCLGVLFVCVGVLFGCGSPSNNQNQNNNSGSFSITAAMDPDPPKTGQPPVINQNENEPIETKDDNVYE